MIVKAKLASMNRMLEKLGVSKDGDVQMQATRIVNKRIGRYMPLLNGVLSQRVKYIKSPTEIIVAAPYAQYQYYGKVMGDSVTGKGPFYIEDVGFRFHRGATLRVTDRDLDYTKTGKNPEAGPFWDRKLEAAEGRAMACELQNYINRRGK